MVKLERGFFEREPLVVAKELLGKYLVTDINGQKAVGKIVETEAYSGVDDLACHASKGKTTRTETLFGPPGRLYVYLNYGIFWLTNIVAHENNVGAVLLRAAEIVEGEDIVRARLSEHKFVKSNESLASGPGKLSVAFGITKDFHKEDITKSVTIYIEDRGVKLSDSNIIAAARIGVDYAEHCAAYPWRFYIKNNKFVSKK